MGLLSSNPVFFQGHLIEGVPDPIKHLFGIRPVDLSRNKLDFWIRIVTWQYTNHTQNQYACLI